MPNLRDMRGKRYGKLTVLNRPHVVKNKKTFWWTSCECGTVKLYETQRLNAGKIKSCGCDIDIPVRKKHPLYIVWKSIKQRTTSPSCPAYKWYGARGIKLWPKWESDSKSFLRYVSKLPGAFDPNKSLDRINNDGNYEPENLRFVSTHIQAGNTRKSKNSSSKYVGVYWDKSRKKWGAYINYEGKRYALGRYRTEIDAVTTRADFILQNNIDAPLLTKVTLL